jgi:hypothetical protein
MGTCRLQPSHALLIAVMTLVPGGPAGPSVRAAVAAPASQPAERVAWDFESGPAGWMPVDKTIAVDVVTTGTAGPASKGCLHVSGAIQGGWNYARSPSRPMREGQLYRLTAWLRVDRTGPDTPAPCLKCEFVPADRGANLGRASTSQYDTSRLGTWQKLEVEFRSPAGVAACWVALEKGTDRPTLIDARLDDVMIEPIDRLTVLEQYRIAPLPEQLKRRQGVHPRLYLDAGSVAGLRKAIETTRAGLWKNLKQQADAAVKSGPPKYILQDKYSGDEQLWQRGVGNTMPVLAMAWLLTQDKAYLAAARDWAMASCDYPTWGLKGIDGMDLAAGHQLFGLALVYDWCFADLDEPARKAIRQTLIRRGSAMFDGAATGRAWWRQSYLQNHLWVSITGLSTAGLAILDEHEDAILWVGLAADKFKRTMDALGPDGASHEGVGYWGYGVEYMLKFMHLSRDLLGVNLYDRPWWRNTAAYRQYLALPRNAWTRNNNIVDLADCPRSNWYGPDYLLRSLAHEFRDGRAQWLAEQLDAAGVTSHEADWLNLIWYDPAVKPLAPADAPASPTLRHFADLGIVSARNDWSGDESLVVFKCGPFIGHEAIRKFTYDPGGGHVHPDAAHFVLFGCGEWLIRDDGYQAKQTGQHNTLLVDGRGQLGEGRMWFDGSQPLRLKAAPRIVSATSTPQIDEIVADAAEAYPADLGIKRFVRHLAFIKPNVLIVADDIELSGPRAMELRFHTENKPSAEEGAATRFVAEGKGAKLRLELLTAEGVAAEAGVTSMSGGHDAGTETPVVRLRKSGSLWRNVVALSWSSRSASPPQVQVRRTAGQQIFSVDGKDRLTWPTDAVATTKPGS